MAHIELIELVKRFGETLGAGPVTLEVRDGEFLCLLGPSGCGKTTTLRMLAGFEEPTSGLIRLDGVVINDRPVHRRGMAMVFQNYALFAHYSVFENVGFGLRIRRVPEAEVRQRASEALRLVGLEGLERRYPAQLSGGQQQRVSLARAVVVEPRVLLLDEPLSNLDLKLREQMRGEIRRLQRKLGITAVYVTHDQGEALCMADRIAVMHAGRIEQVGPPHEIYERPASPFVADFIGQSNLLPGRLEGAAGPHRPFVTDGGLQLLAVAAEAPALAGAGLLLVRPERISLALQEPATANRFPATVEEAVYLGDRVVYRVRSNGAPLILIVSAALVGTGDVLRPGDHAWVGIRPEDCTVIPGGR